MSLMVHVRLQKWISKNHSGGINEVLMPFQVIFDAWSRQRGISDHDGPARGDGVRHRGPETAAVWPDRQKLGEQKPPQAAAPEVRKTLEDEGGIGSV